MDPVNIVENIEQTAFHPQMDRQMDNVKPVYPFSNFLEVGGIKIVSDIQAVHACKIRKRGQNILGYQ